MLKGHAPSLVFLWTHQREKITRSALQADVEFVNAKRIVRDTL
jgi:hypothetical protein